MNLSDLHTSEKSVSTVSFFKGEEGQALSLQIEENEELKEHITKVPALLICLEGEVVFENEKGVQKTLLPTDYINIEPLVKHKVNAILKSSLLLFK